MCHPCVGRDFLLSFNLVVYACRETPPWNYLFQSFILLKNQTREFCNCLNRKCNKSKRQSMQLYTEVLINKSCTQDENANEKYSHTSLKMGQ
jgi:hypothetical protein